jgi:histidyl-tRNA synthetase
MGVWQYCDFYPSIIRGLAYYTGVVFEVDELMGELRAICGGGRYDNLLRDFGGPAIPATGMGMGDCVLEILLREKGLIEKNLAQPKLEYFVACVDEQFFESVLSITAKLRRAEKSANFSYKCVSLSKQLKQASAQNAQKCIIIGEEFNNNQLIVKDMDSGEQELVDTDEFLSQLKC